MPTIITRKYAANAKAQAAATAVNEKFGAGSATVNGDTVTARANWGLALAVKEVLEAQGPVGGSDATHTVKGRAGVGLSAALDLPELLSLKPEAQLVNNSTPFSKLLGLPVLSPLKPQAELVDNASPLSSGLGLPTIDRSAPFSKLVKDDRSRTVLVR
jgi:hypothetical protein